MRRGGCVLVSDGCQRLAAGQWSYWQTSRAVPQRASGLVSQDIIVLSDMTPCSLSWFHQGTKRHRHGPQYHIRRKIYPNFEFFTAYFCVFTIFLRVTTVAQWLRCCATNWKVAGSIPAGVIGIFHWHNTSDPIMVLGSTQPLTEMSTRSISWG